MVAFLVDTLRGAIRMPASWVLCALGVLSGWAGLSLAILAVGGIETQAREIILSTSQTVGALAALWVAAGLGADDVQSAFALSAECTRPGRLGRILGRAAGSALIGLVALYIVRFVLAPTTSIDVARLSLLGANTWVVVAMACWGTLFGVSGRAGLAVLAGSLAWMLGHLPWDSPDLVGGPFGRALSAWLPGPREPASVAADAGYTLPAAVATLCLAWAFAPRREPGD